jgi:hypothetical protein
MGPTSTPALPPSPGPSGKVLGVLITMSALLMLFSVASWMLGNQTLAAAAGVAAIALIGDICRRLLGTSDTQPLPQLPDVPVQQRPTSPSSSYSGPANMWQPPIDQPTGAAVPVDGADVSGSPPADRSA